MPPNPSPDPVAQSGGTDQSPTKPPRFPWKWVLLIPLVIGLWMLARQFNLQSRIGQALDWVSDLGPWGVVLFIVVYIVAAVLFLPGDRKSVV